MSQLAKTTCLRMRTKQLPNGAWSCCLPIKIIIMVWARLPTHYKQENTSSLWLCKVSGGTRSFFCRMTFIDPDVDETDQQICYLSAIEKWQEVQGSMKFVWNIRRRKFVWLRPVNKLTFFVQPSCKREFRPFKRTWLVEQQQYSAVFIGWIYIIAKESLGKSLEGFIDIAILDLCTDLTSFSAKRVGRHALETGIKIAT